jgi:hypothetical protein
MQASHKVGKIKPNFRQSRAAHPNQGGTLQASKK